jgi:hypothetical protein
VNAIELTGTAATELRDKMYQSSSLAGGGPQGDTIFCEKSNVNTVSYEKQLRKVKYFAWRSYH